MPNAVKGSDIKQLLWYLAGPGRANEHTNPRVLAGDVVTMAVYAGPIDRRRAWELGKLLDSPRQTLLRGAPVLTTSYKQARALMAEGMARAAAYEAATKDENTWHCSLALKASEGQLPDATWAAIATDFMREMGYIDRTDDVPDVRWAAVHHGLSKNGNDHIHIAMPVVRPDGSLADMYRDRPRAQAASRVLEAKYGLEVLYTREHGDTEQATKPAERARAERVGAPETDREALRRRVRGAAMAAESEAEWLRLLRADGVIVAPRWAPGGRAEVVGYSVRLPAQKNRETGAWEKSISYGGLRLGKDMTLPSLRAWTGWDDSARARQDAVTEWQRVGRQPNGRPRTVDPMSAREAVAELRAWSDAMRAIPVEDRAAWAQAASQTAGVFAAASVRTERSPGPLDRLSRQLARAGQLPAHQRQPRPADRTASLRAVSRMLWASANPSDANIALIYALTELLLTVRDSLEMSRRANAAAAMASQARKALTEIHMRADGIDPARPYVRDPGSPAWAAAVRASVVVDGLDRDEYENTIATASRTWRIHRITAKAFGEVDYDEKGQIVGETPEKTRTESGKPRPPQPRPSAVDPTRFGWKRKSSARSPLEQGIDDVLHAAEGPLTPPPDSGSSKRSKPQEPERPRYRPPEPRRDRDHGHGR
ncbi:relaxase/mobilization nuclease domain-containing protein [Nocardia otitidiscaviarum]|uniref:relaxase/mobilization nuclease domain-containing protein n=1 Tax=Nocardia otitidiscaviarum TaxID=1823 RepID=UPI0020CE1CBD|nr:relaxase/mobilization nuclease domain-containing protein [Nocardia otitidiscaviarum]MCP9625233.1 relaxase/mobilization nuclease domain-containing protein [Nocardia otitidiscaviarum]